MKTRDKHFLEHILEGDIHWRSILWDEEYVINVNRVLVQYKKNEIQWQWIINKNVKKDFRKKNLFSLISSPLSSLSTSHKLSTLTLGSFSHGNVLYLKL